MYLKTYRRLSASGLMVRLTAYRRNVDSSNPPIAAYCNSIYNNM